MVKLPGVHLITPTNMSNVEPTVNQRQGARGESRSRKSSSAPRAGRKGGRAAAKSAKINASLLAGLQEAQGVIDGKIEVELEEKKVEAALESAADTEAELPPAVMSAARTIGAMSGNLEYWMSRRRRPVQEKSALQRIRGRCILHFLISGYSTKSLTNALAKVSLWMQKEGLSDMSPENVEECVGIVRTTYLARKTVLSWWDELKLSVTTWFESLLAQPKYLVMLGLGLAGGVVAAAVATGVGAISLLATSASVGIGYFIYKSWKGAKLSIATEKCDYLSDWCCDTFEHKEIDEGATLHIPNDTKCNPTQYAVGFTIAPNDVWIPRGCTHNEVRALAHRQLLPAIGHPEQRAKFWQAACNALKETLIPIEDEKRDHASEFENFLLKYPMNRRNAIRRAYEIINNTYHIRNSNAKMFVKIEWLVGKIPEKRDPRAISGHEDEFLAESAPEYYMWTKAMIRHYWCDEFTALQQNFIYTGGMNAVQIGALFSHYVSLGWHVLEGDYSRYDGHTEYEALEAEFGYYENSLSSETLDTLRCKLGTTGRSASGVVYSHKGKMCSGLINTSFGNTLRGFMIVAGYCKKYGIPVRFVVVIQLGDDNLIFVKDLEQFNLDRFIRYCSYMGHSIEIVHRPDPDFTEYCSMRFWNVGGGRYVLGPKPARVLAKTFICHDKSLTTVDMPAYCKQIALGFKAYEWVPVLGGFIHKLTGLDVSVSQNVTRAVNKATKDNQYKVNMCSVGLSEVEIDTDSVYTQFEKIYGFDPKPLEGSIEEHTIEFGFSIKNELLREMCYVDGVCGPGTTI